MGIRLYREYKLKFYLNARHFIIINGVKGDPHPHTWELALNIRFGRSSFVEFNQFETGISNYLEQFQNKIINDVPPFDTILPTLENMVDYFAGELYKIVHDIDGILVKIEASETPTRSYILNLEELTELDDNSSEEKIIADVMDAVLDDIIE